MGLIFVDCEAYGGCPATGELTEFGAVSYPTRATFHGVLIESKPSEKNPAVPEVVSVHKITDLAVRRIDVFRAFEEWLRKNTHGRPIFVSDNPAFDWQWINDGFHKSLGRNPFGHSGRRISDYYAGLCGNFYETQKWKRLRITKHDHNPVNDAMGNLEAFERILNGER